MTEESKQDNKRLNIGKLLLISFAIFNLGFVVDQTVRWSNHVHGLINGVFHIIFYGITWCLSLLPWSLLVYMLYQWRGWIRLRTQWVLAPAILLLLAVIGALIFQPQTPSRRFKSFSKTDLPTNARNIHYHFMGGGFADFNDTYYFETTPEEVMRIIGDMRLEEDEFYGHENLTLAMITSLPDCPDLSTWKGAKQYKGWDEKKHWFYYLIADATLTKVYMRVGCI